MSELEITLDALKANEPEQYKAMDNLLKNVGTSGSLIVSKNESVFSVMFDLQKYFDDQLKAKRKLTNTDQSFLRLNVFAIQSELAELLDEMNWTWWKDRQFDLEGFLNELRDIQHFVLRAMHLSGMDRESFINNKFNGKSDEGIYKLIKERLQATLHTLNRRGGFPVDTKNDRINTLVYFLSVEVAELVVALLQPIKKSNKSEEVDGGIQETRVHHILSQIQIAILLVYAEIDFPPHLIFVSYVEKNIENHLRQQGKSKDSTRQGYSKDEEVDFTFKKIEGGILATHSSGKKAEVTTEQLKEGQKYLETDGEEGKCLIIVVGEEVFEPTKETIFELLRF